jgi:alpha-ribazole phosphatase
MTDVALFGSLFLVRHTPVKVATGTCYGRTEVPLDKDAFARMLPDIHERLPLHAVMLCSPLSRCLLLADSLQELAPGRRTVVEPNLIEHDFGAWEGRLWSDISREEIDAWAADYLNYVPPDGESVATMSERSTVATLENRQANVPLIVISHAGPLAAIAALLTGAVLSASTRCQSQGTVVRHD